MKGLQKERWFLDADDNVHSHRNLIITFFSPYTCVPCNLHANSFRGICIKSQQNNKQKYAKTINLLCAGNKVFAKYQAQRGS